MTRTIVYSPCTGLFCVGRFPNSEFPFTHELSGHLFFIRCNIMTVRNVFTLNIFALNLF